MDSEEHSQTPNQSPMEPEPRRPPAEKPRALLFRLGGALFVGVLAFGVMTLRSHKHKAEASEGAAREAELREGPLVRAAKVALAPPGRAVTLSGEVQPFRKATLYAKISGYLESIRVDKGDRVKQNQVLGIIESPETEKEALSKEADLEVKKGTEQRYRALNREGLVSSLELDKASADLKMADADLARLNALRGYEVIRAPYDGVITARYADPGALLQAATSSQGALPLVDIADINQVRIYVYLGQNEALFVREGDPVSLWTEQRPTEKINAKITRFSKQLDPRSRTMLTEIDVDNKAGTFLPGTFVRVSMNISAAPGLSVPTDAIFLRNGRTIAALIRDGHAHFVPVETGDSDGKTIRILSGLKEGDVVGLHVGDEVDDGGPVRVAGS